MWLDSWIIDGIPRPPRYQQEALVDLTMEVTDLIDIPSQSWNRHHVCQVIHEDDIELVLQTKLSLPRDDSLVWSFSANGSYNTRSRYKLLDTLKIDRLIRSYNYPLWKGNYRIIFGIRKLPQSSNIFLWRALSGALAVRQHLSTQGIALDTMCTRCGLQEESICTFSSIANRRERLGKDLDFHFPLRASHNSVFLNFHQLIAESRRQNVSADTKRKFPWILWQIWKARNAFCFERTSMTAKSIFCEAE